MRAHKSEAGGGDKNVTATAVVLQTVEPSTPR